MTKTSVKQSKKTPKISPEDCVRIGRHVTWVGFWWNAFLGILKVLGGIFSRSEALVADGIHSFSDFLSDIIVILMVGIARKKPNQQYQFGHGRFEALATVLLSLILLIAAFGIFYESIVRIVNFYNGIEIPRPGYLALIIIAISIISKEWLYHYTVRAGKKIKSEVVIANAWHHRSDSWSSMATLLGVAGAIFLGEKWRVLDPIAAIIAGIFIFVVSMQLAIPALKEMLGVSLDKKQRRAILKALKNTPGVISYHSFKTFKSGNDGFVFVHITVDANLTIKEAHEIATNAEKNIHNSVSDLNLHVDTHIEPHSPRHKKTDRTDIS